MTDNLERDEYIHPGERFSNTGYSLGNGQGLSVRDYFAGQALAGLWADPDVQMTPEQAAKWCYDAADAMLAAREEKQ